MAGFRNFNEERIYREHPGLKEAEEFVGKMDEVLRILTEEGHDDIARYKAKKEWEEKKDRYDECLLMISGAYPERRR